MPDIKKVTLTDEDEFMILACDGIWNFLTSQTVVEFISTRLKEGREKISEICEEVQDIFITFLTFVLIILFYF